VSLSLKEKISFLLEFWFERKEGKNVPKCFKVVKSVFRNVGNIFCQLLLEDLSFLSPLPSEKCFILFSFF